MGVYIGVQISGDRAVLQYLSRMGLRFNDMRPVWNQWYPALLEQEKQVFAAQGLPTTWPPLSPRYAAWKAKVAPGKPIMRLTDRLYQSLTEPGAPGQILKRERKQFRFGTRVPYAEKHHLGRGVPVRRSLVILPDMVVKLAQAILNHLTTDPRVTGSMTVGP